MIDWFSEYFIQKLGNFLHFCYNLFQTKKTQTEKIMQNIQNRQSAGGKRPQNNLTSPIAITLGGAMIGAGLGGGWLGLFIGGFIGFLVVLYDETKRKKTDD